MKGKSNLNWFNFKWKRRRKEEEEREDVLLLCYTRRKEEEEEQTMTFKKTGGEGKVGHMSLERKISHK